MTVRTLEVVGREEELGVVFGFLEDVGRFPAALLLEGEAGIGKTTLWQAEIAAAGDSSFRVLAARHAETERVLSFTVLGDLLAECRSGKSCKGEAGEDWTSIVGGCGSYPQSRIRKGSVMITNQTVINRRTAIGGGLVGLAGLFFPGRVMAQGAEHNDSFVLLLKGLYQPVVHAPKLGLSTVDLNDGSYSTTKIYPVDGIRGNENENENRGNKHENKAIGNFYVQFVGDLCAYHIPGGSFSMRFTGSNASFVDDGQGGRFLEGTFELTILEATGIYRPLVGGHNHMVDKLHFLAPGDGSGGVDEYCFCFISRP